MSEVSGTTRPDTVFRIRGHHFWTILESYDSGGIENHMRKNRLVSEMARGNATSKTVDLSILDNSNSSNFGEPEQRQAYAIDQLGDTDASADTYERKGIAYRQRFHDLKPEDTVVIGVGILDGICDGCTFKRHCNNTTEAALKPDYIYLKAIHSAAEHLGMAAQAVITGDESDIRSFQLTTNGAVMHRIVSALLAINEYDPMEPFARGAQVPGGFAEVLGNPTQT